MYSISEHRSNDVREGEAGDDELLYRIALGLLPGVGVISAKKLIAWCGGPEAVFREKRKMLLKIPGIGRETAGALRNPGEALERAAEEVAFIRRNGIRPVFYLDKDYPRRLQHCDDGPLLLYVKGGADLNAGKMLGVVGSRETTPYGREVCRSIVNGLAGHGITIVSGLAYGIDICAHRTAMGAGLPTVAVLGNGLDTVYPPPHAGTAAKMLAGGALVTEFMSGTKPDRENFPMRNRIVAGMIDGLLVVESGEKGGSLITADIAGSYNRDVFAVPGRAGDLRSAGCNALIRSNKAALVESAADILHLMDWDESARKKRTGQRTLFAELTEEQRALADILRSCGELSVDELCVRSGMPVSKVSSLLLTMEFAGAVTALPGKRYRVAG